MKERRKWLPLFSELIDRLSIHQLKEVFLPEHKDKYALEMRMIEHDLSLLIREKRIKLTGEMVRAIIVIAQMNVHIWYNESKARLGKNNDQSLLRLTHGLNGIRNRASNYILEMIGEKERGDYKIDCLASEFKDWEVSLENGKDNTHKT